MREIIKLGVFLLVVGALSGLAVGFVNNMTEPVIAERNEQEKLEGFEAVYPESDEVENETDKYLEEDEYPIIEEINEVYVDGELKGIIYTVAPNGYEGSIVALVGFDLEEEKITSINILEQQETPGLGDACEEPEFMDQFSGISADEELEVVKQQADKDSEIESITASTITSEAVVKGVNAAREHFTDNFIDG